MKRILFTLSLAGLVACGGKKEANDSAAESPAAAVEQGEEAPKDEAGAEAAQETDEDGRVTGPIAIVNGVEIDSKVFYEELEKITSRGAKIPADRIQRIEQNILKRLIEQTLISQAVDTAGVEVSAEDIAQGVAEYKERFQNEEQFENYLKHGKVTKESIEQRIRERRALEILLEKQGDLKVSDAEARTFYEENERFYTEKAGIRASHILVKLAENASEDEVEAANKRIAEAQERLKKGEDFAAVAEELSDGPVAKKGGDLGFFSKGRMVKEFEEVAFNLEVDEVSEPVRTRFGLHIIKLTDQREDRKKDFDEVKEQIVKSLQNKKFFTERRKLLAGLEKTAEIEKFLKEPEAAAPAAEKQLEGEEAAEEEGAEE